MLPLLLPFLGPVIDKLVGMIPDPEAQAKAKAEAMAQLIAAAQAADQAQTDTNKVEAASTSVFVAGWRPFIGWICGLGLASQFIIAPFATWGAALFGHVVVFPALDLGTLMTLLLGMLGLGAMRTTEKLSGVGNGLK